jgi:transcriptional regulator with XRE-family HTH domain
MNENNFGVNEYPTSSFSSDKIDDGMEESSEQTIRRVLSAYELGRKIRQLRLRKKVALVDLGKHTGLSASMLSQLENGKLVPTLPTLARIAMVFDVGLDHFFVDRRKQRLFSIIQAEERIRFPERPGMPQPSYFFECLAFTAPEKGMQAYLAEFARVEPGRASEHFHEGSEFLYVTRGSVIIRYQDEDHELQIGDSLYFDSSEPHSYRGNSEEAARALVVTVPPRL